MLMVKTVKAMLSHLVNVEIKGFSYQELKQDRNWVAVENLQ